MSKFVCLVSLLVLTSACSQGSSSLLGPSAAPTVNKAAPTATVLTTHSDSEFNEWIPFNSGYRRPSSGGVPTGGSAQCRQDCNEPVSCAVGFVVIDGQLICPEPPPAVTEGSEPPYTGPDPVF